MVGVRSEPFSCTRFHNMVGICYKLTSEFYTSR